MTNSPSQREDLFLILMLVTLASSVNIIMGYTGYVSFGHIVYFGLGGYIGSLSSRRLRRILFWRR